MLDMLRLVKPIAKERGREAQDFDKKAR